MRMSVPRCSKCVAKLCRKVWALICLVNPARRVATLIALLITLGIHMMTSHRTRQRIGRHIAGGEQILPSPLLSSSPIFAAERVGQIDLAPTFSQVSGMQHFHFGQMIVQQRNH